MLTLEEGKKKNKKLEGRIPPSFTKTSVLRGEKRGEGRSAEKTQIGSTPRKKKDQFKPRKQKEMGGVS